MIFEQIAGLEVRSSNLAFGNFCLRPKAKELLELLFLLKVGFTNSSYTLKKII